MPRAPLPAGPLPDAPLTQEEYATLLDIRFEELEEYDGLPPNMRQAMEIASSVLPPPPCFTPWWWNDLPNERRKALLDWSVRVQSDPEFGRCVNCLINIAVSRGSAGAMFMADGILARLGYPSEKPLQRITWP